MKSWGVMILLVSLFLAACQGSIEDAGRATVELIDRIQIAHDPDNVLRMDIRITLKQEVLQNVSACHYLVTNLLMEKP